jgi:glutaredoxin 3
MPEVVMYSSRFCPYCIRARMLFESKNISFTEVRVDEQTEQRSVMEQRSQRTSVPQIFIDDYHVGGCDDLFALDSQGELDLKLGIEA